MIFTEMLHAEINLIAFVTPTRPSHRSGCSCTAVYHFREPSEAAGWHDKTLLPRRGLTCLSHADDVASVAFGDDWLYGREDCIPPRWREPPRLRSRKERRSGPLPVCPGDERGGPRDCVFSIAPAR